MKSQNPISETLFSAIRGEQPLSVLAEKGIHISFDNETCFIQTQTPILITPSASDIVSGFLAYKTNPEKLKQWATFLMSASQLIDLDKLENHSQGELLINALWDASFTGTLDPQISQIFSPQTSP